MGSVQEVKGQLTSRHKGVYQKTQPQRSLENLSLEHLHVKKAIELIIKAKDTL